jgi:hypothetical protein
MKGSNNMSSSIYQERKEEIKRAHAVQTNGVNPHENLLSIEEAHFLETCYSLLGIE